MVLEQGGISIDIIPFQSSVERRNCLRLGAIVGVLGGSMGLGVVQ